MPSPFPGMDPYLEGHLWPDVHAALAHKIRQQLAPRIQPKYVARLEISVIEDETFEAEIGVIYPDVEIIRVAPEPERGATVAEPVATVAPLTITIPKVKQVTVEIRDTAQDQLVASLEILSPVNKREPGLSKYRHKRDRIRAAEVHLLEIDLLRRGKRAWQQYSRIPDAPYIVALTRAAADVMELWPLKLPDKLPLLPVPLRPPDKEAILDLSAALNEIYDEAYYHLSIDYRQPAPPPKFSEEDLAWIENVLKLASD